jgi:mannose-1-phosphate guanylyltransferase/mannose-6-phosphate isomerase
MSQPDLPKQFLAIFNNEPLIIQTMERIKHYFRKNERILIVPEELRSVTYKFVGRERVIIEPMRRNTASAICLVAKTLERKYGDGVIHVMPADHLIRSDKNFIAALKFGQKCAEQGYLVTYGIKPNRPETGYGYIKIGKKICTHRGLSAFGGGNFTEKPSLRKARQYLKTKKYLWNSGIFTFRIRTIIDQIERFIPDVYHGVVQYMRSKKKKYFQRIPDISIDYGVMEKTDTLCVVRGNFQWDDVGSWLALERYFRNDKNRNVLIGNVRGLEITDSIIYTYGIPLKAYGLKGFVIVAGPRGVLVCKKDRIQDIKKLFK